MVKKNNKTYIFVSILSFILLTTILLGFYPGLVSYDGNVQWQQVQNGVITNSHPFFSTYFMFLLSKIWNSITVVIIYQIVLVSISWGYLCKVISLENKRQIILIYIFTVIVMLTPLISLFSITVWKDIIYTSYLFLLGTMFYEWSKNDYRFSKFKYIILGFLLAMIYSYRHNGVIVAIFLVIIFYILCIKKYRKKEVDKQNFKKSFCTLISSIIILIIIAIPKEIILSNNQKKIVDQSTNDVSISTIDGYMLWMMGAHVKDNNINSNDDKKFLNKIIPLDEWKDVYNPYLINSTSLAENLDKKFLVKNSSKFEKIFIKHSLKYPLTIFNHYMKADALLLNPVASIKGYVYVYCFPEMWNLPEYTVVRPKILFINKIYNKLMEYSFKKPFIMFYEPAFISYLSLILAIIISKRVYGKKIWLFCLPMILNVVSLLPINLAQDLRYVYINYFTFFGLLLMFIINCKKIFKRK